MLKSNVKQVESSGYYLLKLINNTLDYKQDDRCVCCEEDLPDGDEVITCSDCEVNVYGLGGKGISIIAVTANSYEEDMQSPK